MYNGVPYRETESEADWPMALRHTFADGKRTPLSWKLKGVSSGWIYAPQPLCIVTLYKDSTPEDRKCEEDAKVGDGPGFTWFIGVDGHVHVSPGSYANRSRFGPGYINMPRPADLSDMT